MSLISGSYSRACGSGGAPDCRGDMVWNCLREEEEEEVVVVVDVESFVRAAASARGEIRRARDWVVTGRRMVLDAARRLRLMVDMIKNCKREGKEEEERRGFYISSNGCLNDNGNGNGNWNGECVDCFTVLESWRVGDETLGRAAFFPTLHHHLGNDLGSERKKACTRPPIFPSFSI